MIFMDLIIILFVNVPLTNRKKINISRRLLLMKQRRKARCSRRYTRNTFVAKERDYLGL